MPPRVSVLMPVYNAARFVERAVQSILEQTFGDFELLLLDDGSSDGTREIVSRYREPRIRVLGSRENRGIGPTLNHGITESTGEYVARMDADDVSYPDRLECQVAFLDGHPHVGLCGGRAVTFGEDREIDFSRRGAALPETAEEIRIGLLFGPGMIHPTVMFRRQLFQDKNLWYKPLPYAQDYELWSRAFFEIEPANLSSTVLSYRVHASNAGSRVTDTQELVKNEIWKPLLDRLGVPPSEAELEVHSQLADLRVTPDWPFVLRVKDWVSRLREAGRGGPWWNERDYRRVLALRFLGILQYATKFGLRTLALALGSGFHPLRRVALRDRAKFVIKCLIRYERTSSRARSL